MTQTRKNVPTFGNYVWDIENKRLFSGVYGQRETFPNKSGIFMLKKMGEPYHRTADQIDIMCGLAVHNHYKRLEESVMNRKRKKKGDA